MRLYTLFFALFFCAVPAPMHAALPADPPTSYISADPCAGQYNSRVLFVNGVWNTWESAADSILDLVDQFWSAPDASTLSCIHFELGYNHHELYVGDPIESVLQWFGQDTTLSWLYFYGMASTTDPIIANLFNDAIQDSAQQAQEAFDAGLYLVDEDLQEFAALTSEYTDDGKPVLIVAHSQGNFYANQVYRSSNAQDHIAIVAVATPASTVEGPLLLHTDDGDFGHVTLDGDFIHLIPGALDPNSNNGDCGSLFECHAFITSYLAGDDSRGKILDMMVGFLAGPSLTMRTDEATVVSGVPTEIDVLANDEPDTLRITSTTPGEHGSVDISNNGERDTVTYTSGPGYDGSDMFTYSVVSPDGGIGEATVIVTVEAPSAPRCDASSPAVPCDAGGHTFDTYMASVDYSYAGDTGWAVFYNVDEAPVTLDPLGNYRVEVASTTTDIIYLWDGVTEYGWAWGMTIETPVSEWIGAGKGITPAFAIGDAIEVTADATPALNVRATASVNSDIVGTQLAGARGRIVGAEWADGYWWWEVDFNEDPDGWVVEDFLQPTGTLPCDAANPVVPCESYSFTADTYIAGVDYPTDDWAVFYDSDITTVHVAADGSYRVEVNELDGSQYEDLWHNGSHYGEAYGVNVKAPPSEWIGLGSGSVPPGTVVLDDFESHTVGDLVGQGAWGDKWGDSVVVSNAVAQSGTNSVYLDRSGTTKSAQVVLATSTHATQVSWSQYDTNMTVGINSPGPHISIGLFDDDGVGRGIVYAGTYVTGTDVADVRFGKSSNLNSGLLPDVVSVGGFGPGEWHDISVRLDPSDGHVYMSYDGGTEVRSTFRFLNATQVASVGLIVNTDNESAYIDDVWIGASTP